MKNSQLCWILLIAACLSWVPESGKAQTFEQALVHVYQNNPTLAVERAKLREVDEQVSQALSYWRPSIDAQGSTGRIYQNTPDNSLIVPASESINTHTVGVQVTQPIFRGFRTVSGVHAAEKQVAAERANLQNVEEQLFLDAGTAYLDVVHDQAITDLNIEYQKVLRHHLGETQERFSAHDVTRTDIDQATARLKRSEAGRMLAEANLAGHRAAYFHLMGDLPGKLQMPSLSLPPIRDLDEAVALARKQNPAVLASGYNEDEARQEVNLIKGSLLPEVSLVGNAQRQWGVSNLIPGRQDTVQVLAQVTIPLYRSGADYSKARAAVETVTERRMQLEDARRQAEQMVIAAWQNLAATRAVIAADKSEESALQKALHGVKTELPAGTRDTLDVLNAEQELMDARVSLIQARHDEGVSILQVRAAVGALTAESLKLPVSLYDPEVHYEAARDKLIGFDTPNGEDGLKNEPPINAEKSSQVEPAKPEVTLSEEMKSPIASQPEEPNQGTQIRLGSLVSEDEATNPDYPSRK